MDVAAGMYTTYGDIYIRLPLNSSNHNLMRSKNNVSWPYYLKSS